MKTMKIFAMAMVSMFCASVNATELNAPEPIQDDQVMTMHYNYENTKNEYEVKNGEVISKTIYKWNAKEEAWKPCMKYAVSKDKDHSILSCGIWDDSTKSFSNNMTCQSYETSQFPSLLSLPRAK